MNENLEASESNRSMPTLLLNSTAAAIVLLGLGLTLYVLTAPLGVWLGMWDFRQGFAILRNAEPYALWIAGVGAVVTIAGLLGMFKFNLGNNSKLMWLALVATVLTFTAYQLPRVYGYQGGLPPIHDVATDTDNPLNYVAIAPLRADAPNSMVYGESQRMTREEHAQAQRQAYPDIVTQRFSEPAEEIFDRAVAAVEDLGWELVAAVPADGRIEATDTTFWFQFKDDVVIRIERQGNETVLNARSLSRVGGSDFGKNAQRLRDLFARL